MDAETAQADDGAEAPGGSLSAPCRFRYWWGLLRMRFSALWSEVREFSIWVESEARTLASNGDEALRLKITPAGEASSDAALDPTGSGLDQWHRLWQLLADLGIRRVELDRRLESDQVKDVLSLLYACRRRVRRRGCQTRYGPCGCLLTPRGLQFACARTRLQGTTLSVAYSYCATRFRRLVAWFERQQTDFRDHRALFRAGPRYALLASLLVVGIFILYTLVDNWWLMLAVSAAGAILLFAMTYLFFMTVGSVEYDNEEKARRLSGAYAQVKLYADRIGKDLARASSVQRKLLPDPSDMPLADRLDWATDFCPEADVGGDYFDVAALGPRRAAILFSDVSGHGMSAALVTAIVKTTFQSWVEAADSDPDAAAHVREFLSRLNHRLCQLTPDDSFAAVFFAVYDADDRSMYYCNCGHHPLPWRIPADGGGAEPFSRAPSMVLGVTGDIPIITAQQRLQPRDKVVMVTDGILECINPAGEMLGHGRLEGALLRNRSTEPKELAASLVEEARRFAAGAAQKDDQTILAFQVR